MSLSRRVFLTGSALSGLLRPRQALSALQTPVAKAASFAHGVASGDPRHDAVILWTRAAPENASSERENDSADRGDGTSERVVGDWLVANDDRLEDVVLQGTFETGSERDWTVKIDATGLEANRWYWYGFRVGASSSPVGRTRTLPDGRVERMRLAVFSCSNYPFGYFNSYRSAADRNDLDLALHLGDYIYEYGRDGYGGQTGERLGRQVEPEHEILTLADYRQRYAQYRGDQDLQALHARLPMVVVWDDHEIANNTWHSGAQNHTDETEGPFAERRRAAVQSFHEWMPIRSRPGSGKDQIYRSLDLGELATLVMLDTRLIGRDQQLDYASELDAVDASEAQRFLDDRIRDPTRTMLGVDQESWLKLELARSKRKGVPWQILGQQLLIGELLTPPLGDALVGLEDGARRQRLELMSQGSLPLNLDAWDGYPAARERLAQDSLSFANNLVVLAGDTHNSWAFDLIAQGGRQFGVELGATSVTSPGLERGFQIEPEALAQRLMDKNPDLRFANTHERGYLELDITPSELVARWLYVDTVESRSYTEKTGAELSVRATEGPGTAALDRAL